MSDYVYHEGESVKGGNNVCSLVYKRPEDLGIIKEQDESEKQMRA